MKHIRFGVYKPQWDSFSIEKYKGLSLIDLARLRVPDTEEGLFIHEFETFVKRLARDGVCRCEWTKEVFIETIGVPFYETHEGKLIYKLNYGSNCPCKNCTSIARVFDGCTAFIISFTKDNCLSGVNMLI